MEEQQVTIRLEIGPGMPNDLEPLLSRDGKRAVARAMLQFLEVDRVYPEAVAEGKCGGVVAYASHPLYNIGSNADTQIPCTIHIEIKAVVRLEAASPEDIPVSDT